MNKEYYSVTGMSCAACSAHVQKAVEKVEGVKSCSVNLLKNEMVVEYDSPATTDSIISSVVSAGYGAKSLNDNQKNDLKESKDNSAKKSIIRLVSSIIVLIPLFYISMGHMMGWPIGYLHEDYLSFSLTIMLLSLTIMIINYHYFTSGFKALIHGSSNMNTLVALGSSIAFIYSIFIMFTMFNATINGNINHAKMLTMSLSFETAGMVPCLITVGKTLEEVSKGKTTSAIKKMLNLVPSTAHLLKDNKEFDIKAEELQVNDLISVKPGESFPADGKIFKGFTCINESSLTGESVPVEKKENDNVFCGTINQNGNVIVKVTKTGNDMFLKQIIKTTEEASLGKTKVTVLADKISGIFVPTIIGISIVVFLCWLIFGQSFINNLNDPNINLLSYSFERAISVLVIACPCALGLATPVAIVVGNGKGATNGILFKTSSALEETSKAGCVVFDKTGTITSGNMEVNEIISYTKLNLLQYAASLEIKSDHPLAKAIIKKAKLENIDLLEVNNFQNISGSGIKGLINGKEIISGNYNFIKDYTTITNEINSTASELSKKGKTAIYFVYDSKIIGIIAISDSIKEDSKEAIKKIQNLGIKTVLLTGDNKYVAQNIANEVNIKDVIYEVNPIGKINAIKELQKKYKVIMIGDGINDAPSLTQADIGMAIGAGSDIAIDSADVVLMNSSLNEAYKAINLSKITLRIIKENLFWAFFYNSIMIPIAAGALSFIGINNLKPWYGSLAMSLSSITVVLNALRINLYDLNKARKIKKSSKIKSIEKGGDKKSMEKKEYTLNVEGMMCEHCKKHVFDAISKIEGVENVIVDLTNKTATFITTEDKLEKIKASIEEEGYKVK